MPILVVVFCQHRTNREAALSELGEEQVLEACEFLKASGINPTVVRYSLAASSIDSANIVGEELSVSDTYFFTHALIVHIKCQT